ncbi:hypothetical protein [Escherichia coli]|uniref:hypothetical protein n=1 Tax=Escherichia coli TaxID=562 RepID=UPI00398C835B
MNKTKGCLIANFATVPCSTYSAPSGVKAASSGISLQHTQQLVLGSLAFMVVFLHWLTKPTKAAAGIGLANRKPCTVSQPACRNHARQSGVSTPSATTSIVVFRRRLH